MSIIKLIIALCSYGLSIAATDEGIKTPPLVEAEPISPATAQRYPHLDPYIGNVLLSSSSAHVVLAGVALKPSQARWQPAVLAFFALDSQFGPPIWVRRTAISGIDLSTSPNQLSPNSVYQLALETGVDPGGAGAFARFLYGNKATSKPTMQVTWHLDAGTGHLTYLLESNQNGFNYTTPAWQLRLLGRGKTLIGPTMGRGKFSSSEYMYRYSGTDLISVIGFRGLNFKTDEATIEPAPVQPPLAPPADGVDFDLSIQSGGDRTVARVSALRQCPVISGFKHQLKLHEDFWSALSGCQPAQGMATLTVNRAAGDVQDHVARPLFIFNSEGQAVAYTAVQPHAPSILALPAPGEYHLADSPHGRLIEGIEPIKLTASQSQTLTLPLQLAGRLKVSSEFTNIGPALLVIEPLSAGDMGVGAVFDDAPTHEPPQQIDRQIWLLRSKDAQATLTEGAYQISLVNGRVGVFCRHRLVIAAGAQTSMNCTSEGRTDPTDFGGNFVYANINPINAPEVRPRVPFSADLRRALTQGLGLDLVGQSVTTQGNKTDLDILFLDVKSDRFDAGLRYWPANSQLRDRWSQVQLNPGEDTFSRFVRFLRDEGESGWVELQCPNETVSNEDLEQIIRDLKPTALQFFGCRAGRDHDDLISLWSKSSAITDPPILLTAATINLHDSEVPFIPRLAIAARPSSFTAPVDVWTAMQKRNFSLSAGATIQIRELRQTDQKDSERRNWELQVAIAVSPHIRAREILVYSEGGLLKRGSPPADFGHKGVVTLNSVPIAQNRWIRVELRGAPVHVINNLDSTGETGSDSGDAVLAATNFVPVVHLRAKHERPEVQH